jgi:hypothetical protein
MDSMIESMRTIILQNEDLNDPVLEPITFEDDIPLEGSSSTITDPVPQIGLDDHVEEPEIGGESSVDDADFDDDDMEPEDY